MYKKNILYIYLKIKFVTHI